MGGFFKFLGGVVETVVGVFTANPFLIVAGVTTAVGGLVQSFTDDKPQQPKPGAVGGTSEQIAYDPAYTRRLGVGLVSTAGSFNDGFTHDHLPWGGGNEGKNRVEEIFIDLLDHEVDSLVEVWNGSKKLTFGTFNSTLGWPITEYTSEGKNHLYIKFYTGAWDQVADSHCISVSGGYWTSSAKGRWVCYARVTYVASIDSDDTAWAGGKPQLKFVIKGKPLYDPRKDSTVGGSGSHRWGTLGTYEWTDNAAVIQYNLARGIYRPDGKRFYGVGASFENVRFDDAVAAMNACDENVALKAGGTEKRYRAGGEIDISIEVRTAMQAINELMAGETYNVSGTWRIFAGVASTPVLAITDVDVFPEEPATAKPKLPFDKLVNAVYGSYIDPKSGYAKKPLPVRRDDTDIETDGGVEKKPPGSQLDFVQSFTQGQRVLEIKRRKGRRQIRHTRTLPPYAYQIEGGDWISWDSDRYTYSDKPFLVTQTGVDSKLNITVALSEINSAIYDWNPATDELDEVGADLTSADPPATLIPTGVSIVPSVQVGDAGTQVPYIDIGWVPPNSPFVTGLTFQWRRAGTTSPVHSMSAIDVNDANTALRNMLMPDVQYEGRVKFNTPPGVAADWSSWISFTVFDGFILTAGADPLTDQLKRALAAAKPIRDTIADSLYFSWLDQLEGAIAAATATMADHQVTVGILHDAGIVRLGDGTVRIRMVDELSAVVNGVSASVSTVQEVMVDLQGRTSAFWQVTADADGTVAYARLQADNFGSSIVLVADLISLVSPSDGSLVPALSVTDGNVFVSNKIYIGTNLWLDRTVPGLVYNDGVVSAVFGARFGALGDLVIWYGPAMATSAMRKSNGVFWLDTVGGAYFGGSLSAGISTTKSKTTSTATDAETETAIFTYNGHTLTVAATYDGASAFTAGPFDTIGDMNTYCDTIGVAHGLGTAGGTSGPIVLKLYRSQDGGAYVLKQTYSTNTGWSVNKYRNTETLKFFVELNEAAFTISQTWTDDDGTPGNRQYKLVINSFTSKFGAMLAGQTMSLICVEEEL